MRLPLPARADFVLSLLLVTAGAVEIGSSGAENRAVGVGSFLLAAAVLAFVRAMPLALPPLVASVYVATPLAGFDVSPYASWIALLAVACFGAGLYARQARAGLISVLLALGISMAGLEWLTSFQPDLLFGLIVTVGSFGLGFALGSALERERSAAAGAERARVETVFAGERAVQAERERLAVELHDVLAHTLGEMIVQASAAADLLAREAAAGARALEAVAAAGRAGLAETGRLLRVLRDDGDELGLQGRPAAREELERAVSVRRRPGRYSDAFVPACLAALATADIAAHDYRPVVGTLACYWLAALVLLGRRAFPAAMPLAVTAIFVGGRLLGLPVYGPAASILFFSLAFFTVGRRLPRSQLPLGLASTLASLAVLAAVEAARGGLSADVLLLLGFTIGPWTVGAVLQVTLERTRAHAAAGERARLEQEREVERSARIERRRIARELHDVLAASLSVMSVQAALAAELAAGNVGDAAAAVAEVERAGRDALGEVGRLLRLVRGDAGTRPQQRLADLPVLVADYVRAGLRVELEADGVASLPAGIDLSLYRLVQEALTNALKHAPGSDVRVRIRRAGEAIAVEVTNSGPTAEPGAAAVPSGQGLVGLRERVSLLGGRFVAGPAAGGGFLLSALIPLAEAA